MRNITYPRRARRALLSAILLSLIFLSLSLFFLYFGRALWQDTDSDEALAKSDTLPTVVIDPGHGGIDAGASVGQVLEKDINLAVSLSVKRFLSLYGVRCVMTRETDTLLSDTEVDGFKASDLKNRVAFARSQPDPVFVSIHMNKFPDERYSGLQVFYSPNDPKSEALAIRIREGVVTHLQPENRREVKRSGSSIYVLDRLECPAVLIECGFLSNPEERARLTDSAEQERLALVIASSVIDYLSLL